MRRADVVVVGAGVIGSACAYRIARSGANVILVDRAAPGGGASDTSAGGIRQQNRDRRELLLAVYAIRLWTSLESELSADVRYRRSGHITLAEAEPEVDTLRSSVEQQRSDGLDIALLDADELRDVAPGLGPTVLAGSYCPTDGHADPARTTRAFVRGAKRAGASVLNECRVSGVSVEGGRVVGLETTRGAIACDRVVNAAGAWGGRLAAMAGVELPITGRALQMSRTAPVPRALGPVLGSLHRPLSLKQTPDGSFLIGGGRPGRMDIERFTASAARPEVVRAREDAIAVLPAVRGARLRSWWAGLEAFTSDGIPVIGPLPGVDGIIAAVGFSGHGFALAPAVGVIVERLLAGSTPPVEVDAFAAERLATPVDGAMAAAR